MNRLTSGCGTKKCHTFKASNYRGAINIFADCEDEDSTSSSTVDPATHVATYSGTANFPEIKDDEWLAMMAFSMNPSYELDWQFKTMDGPDGKSYTGHGPQFTIWGNVAKGASLSFSHRAAPAAIRMFTFVRSR